MSDFTILQRTDTIVVAQSGVVSFAAWLGKKPQQGDIVVCMQVVLQTVRKLGKVGIIVAIHPDTPLPDEAVRSTILQEMKKLDPFLVCGATVIEKQGFAGSAARAVASTLQLLSRTTHPEKIVASGDEAARFLATELARGNVKSASSGEISAAYTAFTSSVWSRAH